MTSPAPLLAVESIWKHFDSTAVLRDISCSIAEGEIVALLGPSGCGKSTLLRIITGLEQADRGRVLLNGVAINTQPVHQRGFGLMFQDWALFPHRNVAQNIAFGLRMHQWRRKAIATRVDEMLELVGLVGYGQRSVFELSGGERQRVALARALAPRPRLLLLDEPLGSLDRTLRERLTLELRTIIHHAGVTAIYVTHDQIEAFTVADRLIVMQAGTIAQSGPPQAIYQAPASEFVARFLGLSNLVEYQGVEQRAGLLWLTTDLGSLAVQATMPDSHHGLVVIRPEAALIGNMANNHISGIIRNVAFQGNLVRLEWEHSSGIRLELDGPTNQSWSSGETWEITLAPQAMSLLPAKVVTSALAGD